MTRKEDREYLAKKKAEAQEYREWRKFDKENQPRDNEEARNATAEDASLAENFKGILDAVGKLNDEEYDKYLKRWGTRNKLKKAGTNKNKLTKARQKKKKRGWFW